MAGFLQGQNWLNGVPEVHRAARNCCCGTSCAAVAGGMVYVAAWIQLVNIMLTIVVDTRAREARMHGEGRRLGSRHDAASPPIAGAQAR